MQTLYLIRHTTPAIAPGICYGQLDVDVADSFAAEAHHALNCLPPVELILTSPLLRTRRLAEHLAQVQGCELRSDARLIEKHFGAWEGRAWDDIARNEIDAWDHDFMGYAAAGGESAQQLMQRVQHLLHEVTQLPQNNIALVAHAGSIRAMLALMGGMALADILGWDVGYGAVIGVRPSSRN